jgi:hypothetical protein
MNTKRLAALVALSALLSTAAPALAANPSATGSVTVEWNYAITVTLNMYTQTTASQTHAAAPPTDIWENANAGLGQCNGGTGGSADASANKTVNFGSVVADSTKYTDCLEMNAVDAYVVTNDSAGGALSESETGGPSDYGVGGNGGSLVCIIPTSVWSTTGNTAWTTSTHTSNATVPSIVSTVAASACPGGDYPIASTSTTILSSSGPTTGSDYNSDLELVMAPQMQSGQQTLTVTYTYQTT